MKTTILFVLFLLMAVLGRSQSNPTRIYLAKNGAQTLGALQVYTTLNPDQPIKVKNNGYVLIETDADSLGILRENPHADTESQYTKQKPVFVKFERGKTYFFKLGSAVYSQHFDVEEMTERAFWLYVGLNDLGGNEKKYVLSSKNGLTQSQ